MDTANEVRGHAAHWNAAPSAPFATDEEKVGYEFLSAAADGCVSCLQRIYARNPAIVRWECPKDSYTAMDFAGRHGQAEAIE